MPTGWKTFVDKKSGRTYYYNTKDKTTTWTRPSLNVEGEEASDSRDQSESQQPHASTKSSTKASDKDDPLPEGWKATVDKKSGRTYFYNTMDKRTTWKRPSA
jgi:WW domain